MKLFYQMNLVYAKITNVVKMNSEISKGIRTKITRDNLWMIIDCNVLLCDLWGPPLIWINYKDWSDYSQNRNNLATLICVYTLRFTIARACLHNFDALLILTWSTYNFILIWNNFNNSFHINVFPAKQMKRCFWLV